MYHQASSTESEHYDRSADDGLIDDFYHMALSPSPTPGGTSSDERELYCETVRIESKLFYIDLKENSRGRYLKLCEKRANRPRTTVVVPSPGIAWFVRLLTYYLDDEGEAANKELRVESKVFYFSVGENARGRFLRIAESGGGPAGKTCIIIPSARHGEFDGWAAFSNCVKSVYQQHLETSGEAEPMIAMNTNQAVIGPSLSPPTLSSCPGGGFVVRAGLKRFFFDMDASHAGQYLRITEVVGTERCCITVPFIAVGLFQQGLQQCVAQSSVLRRPTSITPTSGM